MAPRNIFSGVYCSFADCPCADPSMSNSQRQNLSLLKLIWYAEKCDGIKTFVTMTTFQFFCYLMRPAPWGDPTFFCLFELKCRPFTSPAVNPQFYTVRKRLKTELSHLLLEFIMPRRGGGGDRRLTAIWPSLVFSKYYSKQKLCGIIHITKFVRFVCGSLTRHVLKIWKS